MFKITQTLRAGSSLEKENVVTVDNTHPSIEKYIKWYTEDGFGGWEQECYRVIGPIEGLEGAGLGSSYRLFGDYGIEVL